MLVLLALQAVQAGLRRPNEGCMGHFDHGQYVELTMHFKCNLQCEHCMIEGTMDWLEPETITRLKQVITYNMEQPLLEGPDPHRVGDHLCARTCRSWHVAWPVGNGASKDVRRS